MKRFVIRLFVFLAIMFVLDRVFGVAMKYIQDHAKGGDIAHHNYILQESNEDILIFGSSRALHHYNPQIIKDSLNLSCYNCGQSGNGIILFWGWWQIIKERYKPKMIVYDISPNFDYYQIEDNHKYIGWLRNEYDHKYIKKIFEDVDPMERYKQISFMYRYNSKFLQCLTDYIHPLFQLRPDGYESLGGEMDRMKIKVDNKLDEVNYSIDKLKISYLNKFVDDCEKSGVKLIFVASPSWYGSKGENYEPIKNICSLYNLRFVDYSNGKGFVHNNKLFKDGNHLNSYGADEFTKDLCSYLINY